MYIKAKTLKNSRPPKKPSKLVRMALDDLGKVEKLKRYKVDMGDWHDLQWKKKYCNVCFAGCIMAQRFKVSYKEDASPIDFSKSWKAAFRALDYFRQGDLIEGLDCMGIENNLILLNITVVHYALEPKQFKKDMEEVIKTLEEAGL